MSKDRGDRLNRCRERYSQIKAELLALGFVCVGSLQTRHLECGKPSCRCHQDPANRHGPYHYWTRKHQGRTVSVLVGDDDAVLYREWIENNRTLDRTLREMRKVSARALALSTERRRP